MTVSSKKTSIWMVAMVVAIIAATISLVAVGITGYRYYQAEEKVSERNSALVAGTEILRKIFTYTPETFDQNFKELRPLLLNQVDLFELLVNESEKVKAEGISAKIDIQASGVESAAGNKASLLYFCYHSYSSEKAKKENNEYEGKQSRIRLVMQYQDKRWRVAAMENLKSVPVKEEIVKNTSTGTPAPAGTPSP